MELTSINYARLIMWLAAHRKGIWLNKTQLQKILFVCYGLYLAKHNERACGNMRKLFLDDSPRAWPFGPVFPRSYKRCCTAPESLLPEEKEAFARDEKTLWNICSVTDRMCAMSAAKLTRWSHQEGTPWSDTVFSDGGKLKWNAEISDTSIYEYFSNPEWKIGLTA